MSDYLETLSQNAKEILKPAIEGQLSPSERISLYKQFLKAEEASILERHRAGAGGLDVAADRSALIDTILASILGASTRKRKATIKQLDIQSNAAIIKNWQEWSQKMESRIQELESKNTELLKVIASQKARIMQLEKTVCQFKKHNQTLLAEIKKWNHGFTA